MLEIKSIFSFLFLGFFYCGNCFANLNVITNIYQQKVAVQKDSISRSGIFRGKDKEQKLIYQQCKTIYKALKNRHFDTLISKFTDSQTEQSSQNINDSWWLPYSSSHQVNNRQEQFKTELIRILNEHANQLCLPFDQTPTQIAPFTIIQSNWQHQNRTGQVSYQEVFSRNQKILAGTNHHHGGESISCEFHTPDPYVPRGAGIVIKFSTKGNPDYVLMNQETMGPGGAEFVVHVNEDMTFTGQVKKNGITKTCKLEVQVVDEVLNTERAFCTPDMGSGRKILVLHTNEISYSDLKKDMSFIQSETGITADIYSTQSVNVSHMQSDYDAIWVISDPKVQLNQEIINLIKFYQQRGLGLAILADNDPYFATANELLHSVFPHWNIEFSGNYYGTDIINRYDDPQSNIGKFFVHPVTSGLYASISEGITTAHLQAVDESKPSILSRSEFKKVVQNSEGGLLAAGIEQPVVDPNKAYPRAFYDEDRAAFVQRTFLHGAFTSMYQTQEDWGWNSKKSPGTPQFFANIACWTAGAR